MNKESPFSGLQVFFDLYRNSSCLEDKERQDLQKILCISSPDEITESRALLQSVYEKSVTHVELDAARSGFSGNLLQLQRSLYTELEYILSLSPDDRRHQFLIVIPVADRPVMLRNCLAGIAEQCRLFQYGRSADRADGFPAYRKVRVFVFDDSRDRTNMNRIRESASDMNAAGLETRYIGLSEQTEILSSIPDELKHCSSMLLGAPESRNRPHKGPSVVRNIACLYLFSMMNEFHENPLVYFIDSDEEFRISISGQDGARHIHFINYFYWLDRIFSTGTVDVLTGKVVGDPPVSPSVMINTFLGDLISFFERIAGADIHDPCIFHGESAHREFAAEYHDMGKLFGYKERQMPQAYQCSLETPHSLLECFTDFSEKAAGFFYGQHPTREQFYNHTGAFSLTDPARTVYTGNYIFNKRGFRHFIPFAGLRLRMAGPAFGRILRATIGGKFVSANLPLLHRRTIPEQNTTEHRSGLIRNQDTLDLSEEFCRQFWGDVMLFSMESLVGSGYPDRTLDRTEIAGVVGHVLNTINGLYLEHQANAASKLASLREFLSAPSLWWNRHDETKVAVRNLELFSSLCVQNFGPDSAAMALISEQITEGSQKDRIIDAIHTFSKDKACWSNLLETANPAFQTAGGKKREVIR